MANSKSGGKSSAARRHKAARPIQSRMVGRRAPESRRSSADPLAQERKADRRSARVDPGPRALPGDDPRDPARSSEESERTAPAGRSPESASDADMSTHPERRGGPDSSPPADD